MPNTYGPHHTERLAVRVTPEDRRLLEAAARTAQLSLSDLIRRALDAAATATLEAVRADR